MEVCGRLDMFYEQSRSCKDEEELLLKQNTLDRRPSLRFTKTAHARATLRSVYNNVYVNIFVTYRYPAVTIRWPHVGPTQGHDRRRWTNIGSTQGERIVLAGYTFWSCTIKNRQINIRRITKHINIVITRHV